MGSIRLHGETAKLCHIAGRSLFLAILLVLPPGARAAPAAAPTPVPVRAAVAAPRDLRVTLQGLGTVQATRTVQVRAQVGGMLTRVLFREGAEVKKGALLAEIDPRPFQAALDAALAKRAQDAAQRANAERDLARFRSLAARSFASRQQVDTQRSLIAQLTAQIAADRANIEAALLNLSFTRITAPISGRLGLRLLDPGNLVTASGAAPIVTIAEIHPIALVFSLPQQDLPAVIAAMRVGRLAVDALPAGGGATLDRGRLVTIDNTIDSATGTFRLKASFPNPADRLWPGQLVTGRLLLRRLHAVLAVPEAALQHGPDGLFVYVIGADGKVARQAVTVGVEDGGLAEVRKGLAAGARVVVSGASRLADGVAVRVEAGAGKA